MRRNSPLRLDHALVVEPDLPAAVEHLVRRLGLRATMSPQARDRHSACTWIGAIWRSRPDRVGKTGAPPCSFFGSTTRRPSERT